MPLPTTLTPGMLATGPCGRDCCLCCSWPLDDTLQLTPPGPNAFNTVPAYLSARPESEAGMWSPDYWNFMLCSMQERLRSRNVCPPGVLALPVCRTRNEIVPHYGIMEEEKSFVVSVNGRTGPGIQVYLNQCYFVSSVSQCWFVNYLLSRYSWELKQQTKARAPDPRVKGAISELEWG